MSAADWDEEAEKAEHVQRVVLRRAQWAGIKQGLALQTPTPDEALALANRFRREEEERIAALDPRLPWWSMGRVWYYPPWTLTNPVIGTPGARLPFHRSGDEFGRRTWVFGLPLLGEVVVAVSAPCGWCADPGPLDPDNWPTACPECGGAW